MFKNLFKKNVESTKNTTKLASPCACNADNEHCDLILQLRKHQELRKAIQSEIDMLDKDSDKLICSFIEFFKKLEKNHFVMNPYSTSMEHTHNIRAIELTIAQCSSIDIFRMTEELRTYKNKEDIICEKKKALKAVEDDIKEIKSKLGIE